MRKDSVLRRLVMADYQLAQIHTLPKVELTPRIQELCQIVVEETGIPIYLRAYSSGIGGALIGTPPDQVILLIVHPEIEEEAILRAIFHEWAHVLVPEEDYDAYNYDVSHFINTEWETWEKAITLATQRGYVELFDDQFVEETRAFLRLLNEILFLLQHVLGTAHIPSLLHLARWICGMNEPNVSNLMRRELGLGEGENASYQQLLSLIQWDALTPSFLAGVDRSQHIGRNWVISRWGDEPQPLTINKPERAADLLSQIMGSLAELSYKWKWGEMEASEWAWKKPIMIEGSDGKELVAWFDITRRHDLVPFLRVVHALLLSSKEDNLEMVWTLHEGEYPLYQVDLLWRRNDAHPVWHLFCQMDNRRRSAAIYEDALRLYINSFLRVAALRIERNNYLTNNAIAWYLGNSCGPAPNDLLHNQFSSSVGNR